MMKTVVDTCHRDIHCMQISNPLKYKVSTMLITQHKFPAVIPNPSAKATPHMWPLLSCRMGGHIRGGLLYTKIQKISNDKLP